MFDYSNLFSDLGLGCAGAGIGGGGSSSHPVVVTPETCLLMMKKIRTERESGLYEAGGEIFKGLMSEFEKTIEAFLGAYMILMTIYSYQIGQTYFS